MEIYLIRHTETKLKKGFCYGQSNVPLKRPFLSVFNKIVKGLEVKNSIIYSSPLERCIQLAHHFKLHNESIKKIYFDDRIIEMNFGKWEMKKWNEINHEKLNKWMIDFVNIKTPKGECFADLNKRVKEFFEELIISQSNKNKKIIIITHAGVIRSVLCQLLEIPLSNAFKVKIDYGSITNILIGKNSYNQSIKFINRTF